MQLNSQLSISLCLQVLVLFSAAALTTGLSKHKSSLCITLLPHLTLMYCPCNFSPILVKAQLLFPAKDYLSIQNVCLLQRSLISISPSSRIVPDLHFFPPAELADGFYLVKKCAFRHKVLFSPHDAVCILKMIFCTICILWASPETLRRSFLISWDKKQMDKCFLWTASNVTKWLFYYYWFYFIKI